VGQEGPYEEGVQPEASRIGDYRVLGHWTSGSVSHVYIARRQEDPNRLYALKVPRTEHAIYAAKESVFFRGANRGPQTVHAHTVMTREVLDRNGRLYMVTDFVNGELLSRVMKARQGEPWPASLAVMIAQHIARSLVYIHESQPQDSFRPHGEVSPANITLGYDGCARLMDSAIIGKRRRLDEVRHLAPEQAAELPDLDARCDVYGLGLVLWEMLTGQQALTGKNETEIRACALEGRIAAPSQMGAHCDAALDQVVMAALTVDRDDRIETAAALVAALDETLQRIAPQRDLEADLREVLQRVFPRGASRLPRLMQRWAQEPDTHLIHRPDGPLMAIQQAMQDRRTPVAQPFAELDATIEALSQSLPPLAAQPDPGAYPALSVDLAPKKTPRRALLVAAVLATGAALGVALMPGTKDPKAESAQGSLRIMTRPVGAIVHIDGRRAGETPLKLQGLPVAQPVKVDIRADGYAPLQRTVTFSAEGGTRGLDLELQRLPEGAPKSGGADEDFKDNPY